MRILFVDPEPCPATDVEHWELVQVATAAQALDRLEDDPADVVIAAADLPGGDGVALLAEVRRRAPAVTRLILAPARDRDAVVRAAGIAHQLLAKPTSSDWLVRVVQRTCALQGLLGHESIRAAVGGLDKLPSVPRVFAELSHAVESPAVDAEEIAEIVGEDPAISAKLLALVNSAFYTRGRPIKDLRSAVVRLGVRTIRDLALSAEVFTLARGVKLPGGYSIEDLQARALRAARIAQRIAPRAEAGEAFLAALLADVGLLALATAAPASLEQAAAVATACNGRLHDAELSINDVTHAEVGGYLLGSWGLPFGIVEAVANHHAPRRIAHDGLGVAAAVYVAAALAEDEELDGEYVAALAAPADVERWHGFAAEAA